MAEVEPRQEKIFIPFGAPPDFIQKAVALETDLFEIENAVPGTRIESSRSFGIAGEPCRIILTTPHESVDSIRGLLRDKNIIIIEEVEGQNKRDAIVVLSVNSVIPTNNN